MRYNQTVLIEILRKWAKQNNRIPVHSDLRRAQGLLSANTFVCYFGSWVEALRAANLHVKNSKSEDGREAEKLVAESCSCIDLASRDRNSWCDGICPKGKTYDVKSSKLIRGSQNHGHEYFYWSFLFGNKYKSKIDYYFLLGFNEDLTKLLRSWLVPGNVVLNKVGTGIYLYKDGTTKWDKYKIDIKRSVHHD